MISNPYYTHQKYLINEMNKLDNIKPLKILEFGTGDGSAFVFSDYLSRYRNLTVDAYEDNLKWYGNMKEKYTNRNYRFHYVASWDRLIKESNILDYQYDLVFVDADLFETRIELINFIKYNAKVIILHDYDFYNKGVIKDIFSVSEGSFFDKHFGDDFIMEGNYEVLPPTLILKNKKL